MLKVRSRLGQTSKSSLFVVSVRFRSGQVKYGHQVKMLNEMAYGSFGTKKAMAALVLAFNPRKGQGQVKSDRISELKIFWQKISILSFFSEFQKDNLFYILWLEMGKAAFQKSGINIFTLYFDHCAAKNKDIVLKFCMLVYGIYLNSTFSLFQ